MSDKCKKCGSTDTYWREEHPDTGMDEMVLVCRVCEPMPWTIRVGDLGFQFNEVYFPIDQVAMAESEDSVTLTVAGKIYGTITDITAKGV